MTDSSYAYPLRSVGEQVSRRAPVNGCLRFLVSMVKRIAILMDGGYVRVLARRAGHTYDPDFIERFSKKCANSDEEILRILYYDCAPYTGQAKLPVSGNFHSNLCSFHRHVPEVLFQTMT